jgi:hypothetical protein
MTGPEANVTVGEEAATHDEVMKPGSATYEEGASRNLTRKLEWTTQGRLVFSPVSRYVEREGAYSRDGKRFSQVT